MTLPEGAYSIALVIDAEVDAAGASVSVAPYCDAFRRSVARPFRLLEADTRVPELALTLSPSADVRYAIVLPTGLDVPGPLPLASGLRVRFERGDARVGARCVLGIVAAPLARLVFA